MIDSYAFTLQSLFSYSVYDGEKKEAVVLKSEQMLSSDLESHAVSKGF